MLVTASRRSSRHVPVRLASWHSLLWPHKTRRKKDIITSSDKVAAATRRATARPCFVVFLPQVAFRQKAVVWLSSSTSFSFPKDQAATGQRQTTKRHKHGPFALSSTSGTRAGSRKLAGHAIKENLRGKKSRFFFLKTRKKREKSMPVSFSTFPGASGPNFLHSS